MKRNDFNQFTKSDLPLDSSLELPSGPTSTISKKTATKPKINAIGSKAKQSTAKKSAASRTKTTTSKKDNTAEIEKGSIRKKISKSNIELENLEKLNEENIKSHNFRARRNVVLIALLSIMLALVVAFIIIYVSLSRVENNCFLYTHGDVNAVYLVEDKEMEEFRAPANIRGDCILNINISLKINSSGMYNIRYMVKCYNGDKLLNNVVVYEPNISSVGFTYSDGYYHSKQPISGNTTIQLCKGVALNEMDENISSSSFSMEIHAYFEKV